MLMRANRICRSACQSCTTGRDRHRHLQPLSYFPSSISSCKMNRCPKPRQKEEQTHLKRMKPLPSTPLDLQLPRRHTHQRPEKHSDEHIQQAQIMHPERSNSSSPRRDRVGKLLFREIRRLITTSRWMKPGVFFYGEVARRIRAQRSELVGY